MARTKKAPPAALKELEDRMKKLSKNKRRKGKRERARKGR